MREPIQWATHRAYDPFSPAAIRLWSENRDNTPLRAISLSIYRWMEGMYV